MCLDILISFNENCVGYKSVVLVVAIVVDVEVNIEINYI